MEHPVGRALEQDAQSVARHAIELDHGLTRRERLPAVCSLPSRRPSVASRLESKGRPCKKKRLSSARRFFLSARPRQVLARSPDAEGNAPPDFLGFL